jgi:predicted O-linked N-acetylglucosamine transferase (SPINDLY family)
MFTLFGINLLAAFPGRQDRSVPCSRHFTNIKEMVNDKLSALLAAAEIATKQQRLEDALKLYGEVIRIDPDLALAHYKRGNVLKDSLRLEEAVASYDRAIVLNASYANAFCNRGVVLAALKRFEEARCSYDRAIAHNPRDAFAHYNRSAVLRDLREPAEALASLDQAITINPDYAEAYCNRGNLLKELGRVHEARTSYDQALKIHPNFFQAHLNRATLFQAQGEWILALAGYTEAYRLNPDAPFLLGTMQHARMHLCDWTCLEQDVGLLTKNLEAGKTASPPFPLIALLDSPRLHHRAAQVWIRQQFSTGEAPTPAEKYPAGSRIRIGYFSGDFYEHPVAALLAEVFETHDKSKYELTAFSYGPDTNDAMKQRLERSFERFIDVRNKSDEQVANIARRLRIDIAVDLAGHTGIGRSMIFGLRAAPIQINFIGYPGSMGADYIDYLIADSTVIPPSCFDHFSEKIVHLPGSYLPNDSTREVAETRFSRVQLGLPATGFVLCCFNNSYKITPDVFDGWMRILGRLPKSVLWLSRNNEWAMQNLRREADKRGVDPARLVFADRIPSAADHLARLRAADLFLDTRPYNAHATAIDALWAGVPVLTCPGESFAARVAASLLTAIELPELIASSPAAYEERAVHFGTHPEELATLRKKLSANRHTTALFDTGSYTRHLESAYRQIYERHQAGLPPDHVQVARIPRASRT